MAFLRLCAAVLAGAVLTGCGGAAPKCNDDWVKETVIDLAKDGHTNTAKIGFGPEVADAFANQEFQLIAVRTTALAEDVGTSTCEAEFHGRKMKVVTGELKDQVEFISNVSYEAYLTDDGDHYVRLLRNTGFAVDT